MSASMRSSAVPWSASVRIALMRISDLPDVDLIVLLDTATWRSYGTWYARSPAQEAASAHPAPESEVPVNHEATAHDKQSTIIVNAEEKQVTTKELTFDQVVALAFPNASTNDNR